MVGITLSPEQVRSAPPEVRKWLEHEISRSFGLIGAPAEFEPEPEHLVAVTPEEAAAIFSSIRGMLPVVNVFFELGREGESVGRGDIEAYRVADIVRHARLKSVEQLEACLDAINGALHLVRHDQKATLYAYDQRGYCMVARVSQKSILSIWREIVGAEPANGPDGPQADAEFPSSIAEESMPAARMDSGYRFGSQ